MREHAERVAREGAEHARSLGLVAEPLAEIAGERDARAVVLGSRGLSRVRALLGSTTQGVLSHCRRPVLVVRGGDG